MRELTNNELANTSGGIGPAGALLAVALGAAGVYGAAKSIYEFGKAIGNLIVATDDPTISTQ